MRFTSRIEFKRLEVRGKRQETTTQGLAEATDISLTSHPSPLPSTKVRDRWPFLSEPDCPVELQALITRRITRYHEYSSLYPKLRDAESLTELSTVCGKLLEAYLDNQAIFRELEYYQAHHKVLGRHPFFQHFQQIYHLRSMSIRDLIHEQQKTRDNIWRVNSEIRKGDKPHLDGKRRAKLQQYELKLQEINHLLGE